MGLLQRRRLIRADKGEIRRFKMGWGGVVRGGRCTNGGESKQVGGGGGGGGRENSKTEEIKM